MRDTNLRRIREGGPFRNGFTMHMRMSKESWEPSERVEQRALRELHREMSSTYNSDFHYLARRQEIVPIILVVEVENIRVYENMSSSMSELVTKENKISKRDKKKLLL